MTVQYVGVSSSGRVPSGVTLRLTFGATHNYVNADQFGPHFSNDVYSKLAPVAHLYPLTAGRVASGDTVTTLDVNNQQARDVAEIVNQLTSLTGWFVELRRFELLDRGAQSLATSSAGQRARDDATKAAAAQAAADNPLTKFLAGLSATARTAVYVAVAIVVILLLYDRRGRA